MKKHRFTEEEKKWLAEQDADLTYREITDAFNARFGTALKEYSISDVMCKRMKLKRTPKGQFQKGAKPKYDVGAEIVKAGYMWVKVNDEYFEGKAKTENYRKNWKRKSDVVWEKENGEIPKGHFLIFLDGDPMNCDIDNLYLVDRATHGIMCNNRWYSDNAEITLLALKWCELSKTIKEVTT